MQIFNETNWKRATRANTHSGYLQRVRKPSPTTTAILNCAVPDKPRQLSTPLTEPIKEPFPAAQQRRASATTAREGPVPSPRPSAAISPRAPPPYHSNRSRGYRDGRKSRSSLPWLPKTTTPRGPGEGRAAAQRPA